VYVSDTGVGGSIRHWPVRQHVSAEFTRQSGKEVDQWVSGTVEQRSSETVEWWISGAVRQWRHNSEAGRQAVRQQAVTHHGKKSHHLDIVNVKSKCQGCVL
jgi:hypothetical protein